ncbi:diguanylate cyclase (GGDEF) domain-containing protein [Paraburkholderia steynii]|uniref:diguanylate cyclase n=1 Tax=Paraburkholderia steynii TaxID=1245441 RepID=A0A7Z7BE47_9BURK|nr:sensor domain-containing diguanylate cyclase [Paraburkholderia steynii]SDI57550.1 diguanylate cyclase (GGDEF) domain-containing protein [Paraburkholderia steynii]
MENSLILNQPSIIWRAIAFVAIVCLCLVVLDGWRSWNARSFELAEMNIAASNLARAMAQQADDTFKEADTALLGIVERVQHDGTGPVALKRLHDVLVMRQQELTQLAGLFVYDENGIWIVNSTSTPLDRFNNSDREYFKFHRLHADLGPHIGVPVISRSSGKWIVPVSRRINKPDGSFSGVVLATIDIDFFKAFYSTLQIGNAGAVALVLNSGVMLIRRPFDVNVIGKNMRGTQLYRHYTTQGPTGTAFIKSAQDGVTRLNSYRSLQHYPVFVAAALSKDEILHEWWRDTIWHAAGVLCLVIVVGLFGWHLIKQIELRTTAEAELTKTHASLEKVNRTLEQLAMQDGLTGLANRRQFDVTLQSEFNRATRHASSLALIMLDVDFFKQYNDIYGHAAGDECLRTVGGLVMDLTARRPGDLAARYGGEEIAVLLPNAGVSDAVAIANDICDAIRGLEIEHAGNPVGFVTISAGVDAQVPIRGASEPTELMLAADRALYEAKKNGRNRVLAASDNRPSSTTV